ncbi:MAG: acyl-ACP--UDP-N-acetylglucosamine O-acyltransferase [Phycisphaerae bacterium]
MTEISPLAFVDPKATLGRNVRIDPFCYVGPEVTLGDDCVLHPHVTLIGNSTFGARNQFHPQCVLGADPQDLKYKGGPTRLVVGNDNHFRELVTIHRGTEVDRHSAGVTRIGDHNLLMVGAHIAHDCAVGNHCIIANNVLAAGHIVIEDFVNISGAVAIQHFSTIGRYSFVTGATRVPRDVPPYTIAHGYEAATQGINVKGLQRWKVPDESIEALEKAGRMLFPRRDTSRPLSIIDALNEVEDAGLAADSHVRYLVDFLRRMRESSVHGRVLEKLRADKPEDRAGFYSAVRKDTNS